MIIQSGYNKIYDKILRSKDGRLARVHFVVVENEGFLKPHILSIEPIFELDPRFDLVGNLAESLFDPNDQIVNNPTAFNIHSTGHVSNFSYLLPNYSATDNKNTEKLARIFNYSHPHCYSAFEFFMSQPTRAPSFK